jgi:hypothetical protein
LGHLPEGLARHGQGSNEREEAGIVAADLFRFFHLRQSMGGTTQFYGGMATFSRIRFQRAQKVDERLGAEAWDPEKTGAGCLRQSREVLQETSFREAVERALLKAQNHGRPGHTRHRRADAAERIPAIDAGLRDPGDNFICKCVAGFPVVLLPHRFIQAAQMLAAQLRMSRWTVENRRQGAGRDQPPFPREAGDLDTTSRCDLGVRSEACWGHFGGCERLSVRCARSLREVLESDEKINQAAEAEPRPLEGVMDGQLIETLQAVTDMPLEAVSRSSGDLQG